MNITNIMNLSKKNMGLHLPMLLANTQPLDSWSAVGQFSPPPIIGERHHLRVSLPMSFSGSQSDLNAGVSAGIAGGGGTAGGGGGGRSLFGGSSNSDYAESPLKPMDTETDIEADIKQQQQQHLLLQPMEAKCECPTPSLQQQQQNESTTASTNPEVATTTASASASASLAAAAVLSPDSRLRMKESTSMEQPVDPSQICRVVDDGGDVATSQCGGGATVALNTISSPLIKTKIPEAHNRTRTVLPGAHRLPSSLKTDAENFEIKQELLVDYFHAPHPPAPPDSHPSYSPNDENRRSAEGLDDYAQDLRVSAAAAAAAKGLDFSRFMLQSVNHRRSSESVEEKFTPLNMRKLNSASATSSATGQFLMNSLLSNESISDDNNISSLGAHRKSISTGNTTVAGLVTGPTDSSSSAAAAAAAAALYAESLHRDDCDFIGSNVSMKLRSMDRSQRIIAEKLISEVLYYGQFNELERSAHIQPK